MSRPGAFLVKLDLKEREEYYYATSPNLPGLHVCGPTEEQTMSSAIAAVKVLFKRNHGLDVDVSPLVGDMEQFALAQPRAHFEGLVVQRLAA